MRERTIVSQTTFFAIPVAFAFWANLSGLPLLSGILLYASCTGTRLTFDSHNGCFEIQLTLNQVTLRVWEGGSRPVPDAPREFVYSPSCQTSPSGGRKPLCIRIYLFTSRALQVDFRPQGKDWVSSAMHSPVNPPTLGGPRPPSGLGHVISCS